MYQQKHRPIINRWYSNLTGQRLKVSMLVYAGGRLSKVIVEYVDGAKTVISLRDWESLKLIRHRADTARVPEKVN